MNSSELKELQNKVTKELKRRKQAEHKELQDSLPSNWLGILKFKYGSIEKVSQVLGCHRTQPYKWFNKTETMPAKYLPVIFELLKNSQESCTP